jgi:hypothetical protein
VEPTNDWKVNKTKFPNLEDGHLQVYQEGEGFSVVHVPTGISVQADARDTRIRNWELAQEALNTALEHRLGARSTTDPNYAGDGWDRE